VPLSFNAAGTDRWGKQVRLFDEPLLSGDTFGGAGLYGNTAGGAGTGWYRGGSILLRDDPVGTFYLGFRIPGEGYTYGWIEFDRQMSGLTITRWGIEEDAATTITLPSQGGGGGAVPGLGGIAALACGAAGVRRSRQRVA